MAAPLVVQAGEILAGATVDVRRLNFLKRGLRGGQPCGEQPEGRAGDVVESDFVAELDGFRIAAMFAADADLQVGPGVASLGSGHLDEDTDASLVEGGEGVLLEDALLDVGRQEVVDVVARDAEGGLREVVGAEAEELGFLGDLVGSEAGAW